MNTHQTDTSSSALELLIDWAIQQDSWIRLIVDRVIAARRPLTDADVDEAFQLLLAEKGLADGPLMEIPALAVGDEPTESLPPLRLVAIRHPRAVNALLEGQEIVFNARLTVVYGENASGKTGYVRILKQLADARTAEEVLPKVYGSAALTPTATVDYSLGKDAQRVEWQNDGAVAPLTRISVFDPVGAPLHVDEDLNYLYTPADLSLFEFVHQALSEVRDRLEVERSQRAPSGNPFLSRLKRGTPVYTSIESLRASSDIEELRRLSSVTERERKSIEELRERVIALQPKSIDAQLTGARATRDRCAVAVVAADALLAFDVPAYEAALLHLENARRALEATSETLFADDQLPGVHTTEWKAFIQTAHEYSAAHIHQGFPEGEEVCPYCRQHLGSDAEALLTRYHRYLTDTSQQEYQNAARNLGALCEPLLDINIEALGQVTDQNDAGEDGLDNAIKLIAAVAQRESRSVGNHKATSLAAELQVVKSDRKLVDAARVKADQLVTQLRDDASQRDEKLRATESELRLLEDRVTLAELLPAVETYVSSARWVDLTNTILRGFQGLLRGLTETTKIASEGLLNRNFETAFDQECTWLRCPPVRLDFPGRRGATIRHKSVGHQRRPREVLSEGEMKVIALADFLAEISLRDSSAPLVFDDPITSLDYRRVDEVADRLIRLSEEHQVIVFTHNLLFASKLLAAFEESDRRDQCSYYEMMVEGSNIGLVQKGTHPRMDTISAVAGRVRDTIQEASAESGETRDGMIAGGYGHVRTWIETYVEDHLLQGSVKRLRASISIDALGRVDSDKLETAVAVITPVYDRACRRIWGHSQPMEALGHRPTLEELTADWNILEELWAARRG